MKQLVLSSTLALSLASGSVLAGPTNQQDLEVIFAQQGQPMQVEALSRQEMVETEGEWAVPGAIAGGLAGAWGYGSYAMTTGSWTWGGFGGAVGGGAIAGAFTGPVGVYGALGGFAGAGITGSLGGAYDNYNSSYSYWW